MKRRLLAAMAGLTMLVEAPRAGLHAEDAPRTPLDKLYLWINRRPPDGKPASGTTRAFTRPQTYTITAADGSTKAYTSRSLAAKFKDNGRIRINTPAFAEGSLCHGDIVRHGDAYRFYFQATRDLGRRFQIGLARQPVPMITVDTK